MTATDAAQLVRRWHDIWDLRAPEIADSILASDFVDHRFQAMIPDLPRGNEGVKQVARMALEGSSEITTTIDDVFGTGDKIAARVTVRSTMTRDFHTPIGSVPATGRTMTWTQMEIFRVVDGLLVEHWEEVDLFAMLQQAGAMITGGTAQVS